MYQYGQKIENMIVDSSDCALVADLGNSYWKFGIFHNGVLKIVKAYNPDQKDSIIEFLRIEQSLKRGIISSVINTPDWLFREFERARIKMHFFSSESLIPIKNRYKTPLTLGFDRLACATGAHAFFPECNVISIDAGTCIKFDFVNSDSEYLGGSIAPGLSMRLQAMHTFTEKLPLIATDGEILLCGRNTEESLRSGAVQGAIAEVDRMIELYREQYGRVEAILTGGDSRYFDNQLKSNIFARPNLLMEGLHEILLFNEL